MPEKKHLTKIPAKEMPEKKHWTKIPAKGWNEVLKEDREFREKLRKDNTEWKKMKSDFLKLKNFFSWK